jgi:Bacterial Ig-like domain (group 2)
MSRRKRRGFKSRRPDCYTDTMDHSRSASRAGRLSLDGRRSQIPNALLVGARKPTRSIDEMPTLPTRFVALLAQVGIFVAAITGCAGEPSAPVPVARVLISPTIPFVVVTDSLRLTATALDATGSVLTGRQVQWRSNDETKATVSSTGDVTGKALGLVEITATIGQKVATTTMSVIPAPAESRVSNFFTVFSWPWPKSIYTSPIPTQIYDVSQCPENPNAPCLDDNVNQYRVQWNDVWDWQGVADWAADPRHRGHLYTVGDDLNNGSFGGLYTDNPKLYAADYCTFVRNVQRVDPTAEFSPTMIHDNIEDWWLNDFANGVLSAYKSGKCGDKPISEWIFNRYPPWSLGLSGFTDYMGRHADWAVSLPPPLGAPLVAGAWVLGWGGDDVPDDDPAYIARLREAKAWLFANPKIRMARYLLFEPWHAAPEKSDPHPLADAAGNLNATGRAYAEVTGRIAGPAAIRPNVTCMWTAETTGGPPPYTYEWLVNDTVVKRRHWLVYANSGSRFVLQVRVTDRSGGHSSAKVNVAVSSSAPACAP